MASRTPSRARPFLLVDGELLVGIKQNHVPSATILAPEKSALDRKGDAP
jgi:hypothetical protein